VSRFTLTFAALILAQALHSTEEIIFRLWESFPPARFISTAVSPADPERGFIVLNILLVAFGAWCFFWPMRRAWPIARSIAWLWVVVEIINGIVHPLWALRVGGYAPGVATAPLLLILALYLARQLIRK
jgi:hypothetical protein